MLALLDAASTTAGWPQSGGRVAEVSSIPLPPGAFVRMCVCAFVFTYPYTFSCCHICCFCNV
jgi:hypothetical protein